MPPRATRIQPESNLQSGKNVFCSSFFCFVHIFLFFWLFFFWGVFQYFVQILPKSPITYDFVISQISQTGLFRPRVVRGSRAVLTGQCGESGDDKIGCCGGFGENLEKILQDPKKTKKNRQFSWTVRIDSGWLRVARGGSSACCAPGEGGGRSAKINPQKNKSKKKTLMREPSESRSQVSPWRAALEPRTKLGKP